MKFPWSDIIKKPVSSIIILLIILSSIVLYKYDIDSSVNGSIKDDSAGSAEQIINVMARPVEFTPNDRNFEAVGTGRARQSVEVFPTVAEEVTDVLFKARDKVKEGDVLVQLDDREEVLALKLAQVKLKDARRLLQRYEQAVKEGAVPESEVDSARADVDSAGVAVDQASLAIADRKIIAPFSGFVGIPRVDPGDRVTPTTLITGIDDREIIYVDFEVPEALLGSLSEKDSISATTSAYPQRKFMGFVSALESRVDSGTRTIRVRASLDNSEDLLRPGMSFTTELRLKGDNYPTVPEIALQWGNDGSYVWIVRGGRAEKVAAGVISRSAGKVLLQGQISEGEPVVVEGLERLEQDIKVNILGGDSPDQNENQAVK